MMTTTTPLARRSPGVITSRANPAALAAATALADDIDTDVWIEPGTRTVWVLNHRRRDRCASAACPMCTTAQR